MSRQHEPTSNAIPFRAQDIAKVVPESAIATILEVTVADDNDVNDPAHMRQHEQAVILAIAASVRAKTIFEFGPRKTSRTSPIARQIGGDVEAIVTDQRKSGAMTFDKDRLARLLSAEAIERSEAVRHVDSFRGDGARLVYAPWVGACDLVLVNAATEYNYVKCDSLTAFNLAKPGGIVLWSDYGTATSLTHCLNSLYRTVRSLSSLRHIAGTNLCFWRRGD